MGLLMLDSDWLSNILSCAIIFQQANSYEAVCQQHQSSISLRQIFQRSLQPTIEGEPKSTKTMTKQTNMTANRIKMSVSKFLQLN